MSGEDIALILQRLDQQDDRFDRIEEKNLDRLTVGLGLVWAACIVAVGLLVSSST